MLVTPTTRLSSRGTVRNIRGLRDQWQREQDGEARGPTLVSPAIKVVADISSPTKIWLRETARGPEKEPSATRLSRRSVDAPRSQIGHGKSFKIVMIRVIISKNRKRRPIREIVIDYLSELFP